MLHLPSERRSISIRRLLCDLHTICYDDEPYILEESPPRRFWLGLSQSAVSEISGAWNSRQVRHTHTKVERIAYNSDAAYESYWRARIQIHALVLAWSTILLSYPPHLQVNIKRKASFTRSSG